MRPEKKSCFYLIYLWLNESETIVALIKIALLTFGLLTAAAYLVLLERWMAAWIQDRRGPNRVGIPLTNIKMFGLGQPLADGLKFIFKEEFTPSHVDQGALSPSADHHHDGRNGDLRRHSFWQRVAIGGNFRRARSDSLDRGAEPRRRHRLYFCTLEALRCTG